MTRKQNANPAKNGESGFIIPALIGGGTGLTATLLLTLLAPFLLLNLNDPNSFGTATAAVCALLGGASGAGAATVLCRDMPFQSGMLSAGISVIPLILISLFLPGDFDFAKCGIILASFAAGAGAVSFFISRSRTNRKKNMKKIMKRR